MATKQFLKNLQEMQNKISEYSEKTTVTQKLFRLGLTKILTDEEFDELGNSIIDGGKILQEIATCFYANRENFELFDEKFEEQIKFILESGYKNEQIFSQLKKVRKELMEA